MKIIKRGIDPKSYPIEFNCTGCGTIFETTQTEAKYTPGHPHDQREGPYWTHPCPVCSALCMSSKRGKEPLIEVDLDDLHR